jgi:hypothetical protein
MDAKCVEFAVSEAGCNAISPGLYVAYILFGIALIAAIVLPLMNTLKNPSVLIKSGISLAGLLVIFAIAYGIADDKVNTLAASMDQTAGSVKLIGAGLIVFYITLGISVVGLIYSEVTKALK